MGCVGSWAAHRVSSTENASLENEFYVGLVNNFVALKHQGRTEECACCLCVFVGFLKLLCFHSQVKNMSVKVKCCPKVRENDVCVSRDGLATCPVVYIPGKIVDELDVTSCSKFAF